MGGSEYSVFWILDLIISNSYNKDLVPSVALLYYGNLKKENLVGGLYTVGRPSFEGDSGVVATSCLSFVLRSEGDQICAITLPQHEGIMRMRRPFYIQERSRLYSSTGANSSRTKIS